MNDTALAIPYALKAGLGEYGRHGLVITPEFGPRVISSCQQLCFQPMCCCCLCLYSRDVLAYVCASADETRRLGGRCASERSSQTSR